MDINQIIQKVLEGGTAAYLPHVSINCVVFRYQHPRLQVLFHQIENMNLSFLPGGYVKNSESLEEAAYRNLQYAGIENVYLRQIQTFGEVNRVPPLNSVDLNGLDVAPELLKWVSQRFISVVYYGLVPNTINAEEKGIWNGIKWLDIDSLDQIGLDHAEITLNSRKQLAQELLSYPVALKLLEEPFTLNKLRGLYEAILERKIDRGTFRRKVLSQKIIIETDKKKDHVGRPALLYRFDQDHYHHLLKKEATLGF